MFATAVITPDEQARRDRLSAAGIDPNGPAYKEVAPPAPAPAPAESARVPRYPTDANGQPVTGAQTSELEKARAALYGTPEQRADLTDQGKLDIQNKVRGQFQDYLDAINTSFDRLYRQEVTAGSGRLGRTRATAAAGGTLGGSFGNAALNTTEELNRQALAGVEEQRKLQLAAVFTKIDERAQAQIEAETKARQGRAEQYVQSLQQSRTDTENDIKNLAAAGTPLSSLTDDQYSKMIKASGRDPFSFEALYNASLPDNMKPKITDFNVRLPNGNAGVVRTELDPQTGKAANKQYDLGVSYEQLYGKYPGGTKEVDGILYGIGADGKLEPLTKKTTSLKDMPSSYQEWSLAGAEKGTGLSYGSWLQRKDAGTGGKFSPTADEKSAVNRYLTTLPGATAEDFTKAQGDPQFFYSLLQKAVESTAGTGGSAGFNIQPFKYPFGM